MAEKRTIELEVKSDSVSVQKQFKDLRTAIKGTTEQIDALSKEFGENSREADAARKQLASLNIEYSKLSKTATDLSATFEDVYGELQPLTTRMGEAEDRLYELALAGKTASQEYQDLLVQVAKYRKTQIATDLAVDAASSTMSNKMIGALSGVAAGAEVVTGAMGLIGVESDDVQKAMLKVQSAMALAQGLQGLKEAQNSFKELGVSITNTFKGLSSESSAAGKATSALGPVWKAVGLSGKTALSGIRAGIAATGIGLLVVALGTIVAYWDDITAAVSGVSSELEKQQELSKMQVENAEREVELFDLSVASLKLQGKSEKEILQLRMEKLELQYKEMEEDIKIAENKKKLEVEAAKRNKEFVSLYFQMQIAGLTSWAYVFTGIVDGISNGIIFLGKKMNSFTQGFQVIVIDAIVLPIETALKGVNELLKIAGLSTFSVKDIVGDIKGSMKEVTDVGNKFIQKLEGTTLSKDLFNLTKEYAADPLAKLIFDPEEIAKESGKEIDALKLALKKTENEIDQSKLNIQQIDADAAQKAADQQKKIDDEKNKAIQDYNDKLRAYYDALEAERQAQITDEREKELQAIRNKYEALYKLADEAGQDTSDLMKEQGEKEQAINKKFDLLEIEAQKEKDKKLQDMMKQMDDYAIKQFITAEELKISIMQDGIDKQAAIRKLAYDKEQIELQNKLDTGLITMDEFQIASRANNKAYQDALIADNQAAYKKDVDEQKAAYEQKAAIQSQYADIASQAANLIKDILGKSKAAQKTAVIVESAAGIAKMIISNKLANIGALATPQAIATSGAAAAPVIAANNISLGIGIAANLAATAKALKEIGGGGSAPSAPSASGGGGTSGGGTGGGIMAPNFNVVGNNGLNQLAQLQQQPIKAYVVGSEVTTQQALDRNRITNATL